MNDEETDELEDLPVDAERADEILGGDKPYTPPKNIGNVKYEDIKTAG